MAASITSQAEMTTEQAPEVAARCARIKELGDKIFNPPYDFTMDEMREYTRLINESCFANGYRGFGGRASKR